MATTERTADTVVATALVEHPIVRVVACGSVDDGKSTLIGRLLAEMLVDRRSERSGRLIDGEGGGSMESKKTEGYF